MIQVDLKKPTEADMEKIRASVAALVLTMQQFAPVMIKAIQEAGHQATAMAAAFRRVLEANVAKEEQRRG